MDMWEQSLSTLKHNNFVIPLPSTVNGWEDDMKKWLWITYNNIFSYFINPYLHNNKLGHVLLKEVENNLVYLKADIEPS